MAGMIEGTIVAVTQRGNLVTDITAEQLTHAPRDERVSVQCDGHETIGIFGSNHQEPEMTFVALIGDNGCLQLEIVGDSARMMLGVREGAKVVVKWV